MFDSVTIENRCTSRLNFSPERRGAQISPATIRPSALADEATMSDAVTTASETPIRENLVQRIRERISAGTYLTPEKIDAAVEQLHTELFGRN